MNDIPRRNQLNKCTIQELAIYKAIELVEKLGADEKLTRAVMLLSEAKDIVSDYIDANTESS